MLLAGDCHGLGALLQEENTGGVDELVQHSDLRRRADACGFVSSCTILGIFFFSRLVNGFPHRWGKQVGVTPARCATCR